MKLVFIPRGDNPWFHPLESCPFEIGICRSKASSSLPQGLVFLLKLCTCVKCIHPHLAWGSGCKITNLQCLPSHPCPALTGSGESGHVIEKEGSTNLSLTDSQCLGIPRGASGKEPTCQCRIQKRLRFDPWVGKIPCRRAWQPLQYSCLENPMDRWAWRATVHGVAESDMTEATELAWRLPESRHQVLLL